jgi:hypothetical protein
MISRRSRFDFLMCFCDCKLRQSFKAPYSDQRAAELRIRPKHALALRSHRNPPRRFSAWHCKAMMACASVACAPTMRRKDPTRPPFLQKDNTAKQVLHQGDYPAYEQITVYIGLRTGRFGPIAPAERSPYLFFGHLAEISAHDVRRGQVWSREERPHAPCVGRVGYSASCGFACGSWPQARLRSLR